MLPVIGNTEFKIPVCIADLPVFDFQVSPGTLTEDVISYLERNPEFPGVLIVDRSRLVGLITRLKLFERLGHRFGLELFLRKPVSDLKDAIRTHARPMPGNLKVEDAVQRALSRSLADIYDPVVVELEQHKYRLLDMYGLLLAQSRIVSNLSNIVGKLQQIDYLIQHDWEKEEVFRYMLKLLGQVVPYHQAAVVTLQNGQMQIAASFGYGEVLSEEINQINTNLVYGMMLKHRQSIYLPDASQTPAWEGMEALGKPSAWLGVPLLYGERSLGLLSLGRNINSSFTTDEKETAQAFAQRIITVITSKEKLPAGLSGARPQLPVEPVREPDQRHSLFINFSPVGEGAF